MRFQVLGPLRVRLDRGQVPLAASREQRILAALLLDANRVVPVSRLVEAIWDEHPPTSSVKVVRNCVSMLRGRLAAAGGEIVTDSGGYSLRVPDGDIDLRVFADRARRGRRLAAAGELAGAVVHLREALALWRGPAFTGVTGRLIEAAAAQLNDQRRSLQEERLSLELTLGGGVELVDEIADLVAAEPLRERAHGQLMLALYRAGRRSEALGAYHHVRRLLVGELGIEPGRELTELHRAILNADPGLAPVTAPAAASRPEPSRPATPTKPVPAQLPAAPYAFTGRTAELDELCGLLDAATSAGTGMVAAVSGIAGVGKTALAVHFARLVVDRFPDGQLHVDLRGFHPTGPPLDPGEAVRGFLDAFGVPAQRLPEGLAAQSALLRTLLAGRRVLLVLDNARDSTHVRPLLPGGPGCLTLITSRNRLTGLVTTEGAHPISLAPLPPGDAHRMLARRVGAARLTAEPAAATTITARSAGLPLALAIVASRVVGQPHFPLRAIAAELEQALGGLEGFTGMDAETDVRSVFACSYRALTGPAARLFRLLSIHPGPDLGAVAAASLAGVPPSRVRPLLAELAHAHMVTEHVPGRYTVHDLLRAYAVERADIEEGEAGRLAVTRRMFDHYLGSAHLADLRLHPHRDPIRLPAAAAGVTVSVVDDREAAWSWFGQEHPVLLNLLRRAGADGHDVHAWQLGWAMTTYLDRCGHWYDQAIVQRLALEAADRVGDRDGQARAHRNISIAHLRRGLHGEARDHLWHAVRLYRGLGDQVGQARTMLNLGTVAEHRGQPRLALRYAEHAVRLFGAAGHRSGQANALNNAGWYHSQLGDHELALRQCQRALLLQQEAGDHYWQAHTWDSLGCAHHHLGQYPEATECYRQALSYWREAGERYYESATLTQLGDTHLAAGERRVAREVWQAALGILAELGQDTAPVLNKIRSTDEI